jgi:hypothetical protein
MIVKTLVVKALVIVLLLLLLELLVIIAWDPPKEAVVVGDPLPQNATTVVNRITKNQINVNPVSN